MDKIICATLLSCYPADSCRNFPALIAVLIINQAALLIFTLNFWNLIHTIHTSDDTPEPFENSVNEEENKGENSEEGSHEMDRHV